ncbi:MAG: hypothetical protein IJQ31_14935 [Thermoguttaceae bacterium]|nr:hypothetical protein [Thermoguttaceae bacterium]
MKDATIWQAVTDRIASTLTGCEVKRTYDPEAALKGLEDLGKTLVLVCLSGKTSTMQSQRLNRDDFEFRVFLVDYITAQGEAEEAAAMDQLLTLPPAIYDAFAFRTVDATEGQETVSLKLLPGSDFDTEYLTTHETFVACITMNVTALREVT